MNYRKQVYDVMMKKAGDTSTSLCIADMLWAVAYPVGRMLSGEAKRADGLAQALQYAKAFGSQGTIDGGKHHGMSVSYFIDNALNDVK